MYQGVAIQPLPSGDRGIRDYTLPRMAELIRQGRAHPLVRGFAVNLVRACRPTDALCRQKRIYAWVKRSIRFVPDPRQVELLHEPLAILYTVRRQGWAAGDCDDMSIILGALLESVGIRTRLRAVAVDPPPFQPLRHVFVEAMQPGGDWRRLDPIGERFPPSRFTRSAVQAV